MRISGPFPTLPQSPAADAGIVPGDYIIAVDGRSTAGMKVHMDLFRVLQGAPDTVVRIEMKRVATGKIELIALKRGKHLFSPTYYK